MSILDHNNGSSGRESADIRRAVFTLRDLLETVARSEFKEAEKATICSAIRRADQLVGHGALDLAADAEKIIAKLNQLSPAMAAMSKGAFANLKSRVRKAFRLAKPHLAGPRSRPPLEPAWRLLQSKLATREQRNTSRFFYFASGMGWLPQQVTDAHIDRFANHLREEALVVDWADDVRQTIRAWNKITEGQPDSTIRRLTAPQPKRTPYWIDPSLFEDSLKADISKLLAEMTNPPRLAGRQQQHHRREGRRRPRRRKLKPGTVSQYRFAIISMVSALVAEGVALASITALKDLVSPGNLDQVMNFMQRRAGGRTTRFLLNVAIRARSIAERRGMSLEELEQLDDLVAAVKEEAPRKRGMTEKNKALLDRLDDPKFRDLVYLLPTILVERARAQKNRAMAASTFRTAVAIELLLMCSMRRENLVDLELDKTIRKFGNGNAAYWVIDIAEGDVKNEEPLRFKLEDESARFLETYVSEWRPLLCLQPTPWLFPDADGGMLDERTMTRSIQKATWQVLGVSVSTHQFRHITGELHLLSEPEALATVSQHLAHRDYNTTRTYYLRKQQRQATRRYQERVILNRTEAVQRTKFRSRRKPKT